jgi:cell division protein FtsB|tara:strand:+ start:303 stop:608 length:306 start_codon:yes stop_codon:yes gene_type:complete
MDSKKVLLAIITTLGVIASIYLFLEGKIAFEEYTHWKSREAVLEKELEQLRVEAKNHREFLDRLRRDPQYQDAVARKELGYGSSGERLYRFPEIDGNKELK